MTEITVTNIETRILERILEVLREARLGITALLAKAERAHDLPEALSSRLQGPDPIAFVQPAQLQQHAGLDATVILVLELKILVCIRSDGICQEADQERIHCIANGLVNAVQASAPSQAVATSDGKHFFPALSWGKQQPSSQLPTGWRGLSLALRISTILPDPTSR
jgi:hypothetical protein